MEELVLCHFDKSTAADAISILAHTWATLGKIDNYSEEVSTYRTAGAGPMPLLRYGNRVFHHNHILPFFTKVPSMQTFDLDFDLTEPERLETALYTELCVSRLHPATVYAMWQDAATPKDFYTPNTPFLVRLMTLPYLKLSFAWDQFKILSYLEKQHHLVTARDAYNLVDSAHKELSERLGEKRFFNSKAGRPDFPRSIDIVVYAYLREEVTNLPGHPHLAQSLANYANLMRFFSRMEAIVEAQTRVLTGKGPERELLLEAESFPPKLYPAPESLAADFYQEDEMNQAAPFAVPPKSLAPSSAREAYIGGGSLILLLFFYFRS